MSTGFLWDERYAWHDTGTGAGFMSAGGLVEPGDAREEPGDEAPLPQPARRIGRRGGMLAGPPAGDYPKGYAAAWWNV